MLIWFLFHNNMLIIRALDLIFRLRAVLYESVECALGACDILGSLYISFFDSTGKISDVPRNMPHLVQSLSPAYST